MWPRMVKKDCFNMRPYGLLRRSLSVGERPLAVTRVDCRLFDFGACGGFLGSPCARTPVIDQRFLRIGELYPVLLWFWSPLSFYSVKLELYRNSLRFLRYKPVKKGGVGAVHLKRKQRPKERALGGVLPSLDTLETAHLLKTSKNRAVAL